MTPAEMSALYQRAFPDRRPWHSTEIADELAKPTTRLVAAPHGFALLQQVGAEAEIVTLLIDPDHQRRGHGAVLLSRIFDHCRADGVSRLMLEVDAGNTPAQSLYTAHGFAEIARRAGYYKATDGTTTDAIVMAVSLDAAENGNSAEN